MSNLTSKIETLLRWACLACLVVGGALWALSPVGVRLSELKFKTPDVFWTLFPSAPLLLSLGLLGIYLWRPGGGGWLLKAGFYTALTGTAAILAGDVGLFYLALDETYIMSAPAYRLFRAGLLLFAAGSLLFGLASLKERTLSLVAAFPLIAGSVGGLFYPLQDLGSPGATLWIFFGLSWAWVGLVSLVEDLWPVQGQVGRRRATRAR